MSPRLAADDRPRWARLAHVGALLESMVLAGLSTWRFAIDDDARVPWLPAFFMLAAIGLGRRVTWGRFLFSALSLLLCLAATATLMPIPDDAYGDGPTLPRLLGVAPALPVWWAIVMAAAVLSLLPALAIGWRKHWFRRAAW